MNNTKVFSTENNYFVDKSREKVTLSGINMVCKDRAINHIGDYKKEDFEYLKNLGMNLVRLGIFWESVEPTPGVIDEQYLDEIERIVNLGAESGIAFFLDMHQDLFSAEYEDGAPGWATLSGGFEYEKTDLWSDAYLLSPAVQACFDNFWNNTTACDGIGIQDHFITTWVKIAERFSNNPYVVGYDFFNEPFPGSASLAILEIIGGLKEKILSGNITEEDLYGTIGAIEPITGSFEEKYLVPFYEKIARAVRQVDKYSWVMLETNYFSNAGVPTHVRPVTYEDGELIEHQVYAPHGYDIFVDTDDYDGEDTSRVDLIFGVHARVAAEMEIPMIVGEWGCYPQGTPLQVSQAKHLKQLFESIGAADTYFDFSHIYGNRIIEALRK